LANTFSQRLSLHAFFTHFKCRKAHKNSINTLMKHMVEDTHRHQEKKEKKRKSLAAKELKEDRPPRQPKEGILFPHPRPLVVTANAFSFSFPFISISFPIGFVSFFLALFRYIYIYGQTQKRIQFFLGSCDSLNASTITKIAV